ncbi:glycosyltransferase family 4 protein [Blastococcus colisei]
MRARGSRGLQSTTTAWLRSRVGTHRANHVDVDAWVQLGGGYRLQVDEPIAVYDDMTVLQARQYSYGNWADLPEALVRRRARLQGDVYRSAAACCTESSWAAAAISDGFFVPEERISVVGTGTDWRPETAGRDWSTPRLLFVGLDWERKNGARVLDAFRRLRHDYPEATLDIVGRHPPVEEPGVRGHGVLPRNSVEGRRALEQLFAQATCFVMPSLFEPAGIVFTEALAAGLPSVGGAIGGSRDLIGDAGVVVNPTDSRAIETAVREMLEPARAAEVGARASRRARLFTWAAVSARLLHSLGIQAPNGYEVTPLPNTSGREIGQ